MPFEPYPDGSGELTLLLDADTVDSLQRLARRLRDPVPRRTESLEDIPTPSLDQVAYACIGTTLDLAEQTDHGAQVILRPRTGRPTRLLFAWDRTDVRTNTRTRWRTAWRRRPSVG
jgi:hypothetical protein